MTQIQSALQILFKKHRIVFWYDAKRELRAEFESLLLPGIETIELNHNEFAVKQRILRQQPQGKFLLYHAGPAPADLDNWLLDVQLAQGEFRADQAGLWLSELGLRMEFLEVVQAHAAQVDQTLAQFGPHLVEGDAWHFVATAWEEIYHFGRDHALPTPQAHRLLAYLDALTGGR